MKKRFLLGNEAIALGALEGGMGFAATYPGTPASEIGDTFFAIAKDFTNKGKEVPFYFEYSANEKVALEVCAAASISGIPSLTSMKHVGVNVAADALMTCVYIGCKAGHLIVTADDPSCHSSQNEQDNRFYSLLGSIPMLEPSTPQEARTFTIEGLKASEKFRLPFLLRTTTRLSHMRGVVETGELKPTKPKGEFTDKKGYVVVPKVAKQKHVQLLKKLEEVEKFANESSLNRIEKFGKSEKGIICSGISFTYVLEAIKDFGFECNVLKLGLNNPLPRKLVADFLKEHEQILVIEELEPILETEIKALAHELGINTVIYGKGPELHRYWEYDQGMINKALQNFFGKKQTVFAGRKPELSLPPRSPQLCPGCPHRSTYYAVKKVAPKNTIYPTDIGCYTLGIEDPLNIADYLLCMGSSIGTANGFSAVTGQPVVAFLGDSTFFHAGMPALVNATHHSRDMVVCILDNRTTAMTGHQPNPGIEIDGMGRAAKAIDLVEVAKGLGVEQVDRVNPMNLRATMDVFRRSLASKGTSVVVAKSPCILLERRALRQKGKELPVYQVDQSKCNSCRVCIDELGCPAFYKDEKGIWIDETLCNGCSFCIQVCESKAIRRVKK